MPIKMRGIVEQSVGFVEKLRATKYTYFSVTLPTLDCQFNIYLPIAVIKKKYFSNFQT